MNKFAQAVLMTLVVVLGGCQQDQTQQSEQTVETGSFNKTISYVPAPSEMKSDVIVSGRVSTLKHVDIVNVGKNIPYTYSYGKVFNTPDYDWWVSKRFALKTDYPEERARLFLELLEMSYPHYIEIYGGMEPPNIEQQRIAVVYGSSWAKTMFAFYDDGFRRGISAGGETMYYNRVGYNFPSHRWHHRRYIVIHETAHAFQMAQRGYSGGALNWLVEGLADSIAHHVYDPNKRQLKVMNFDRPPMNYVEMGLEQYEKAKHPSIREILLQVNYNRGIWMLFTHFMLDNPERSHKYKRYQKEFGKLANQGLSRAEIEKVTQEIYDRLFPDWQQFEKTFADWMSQVQHTFHIVREPWEQDGNAFWVRIDPPPDYRYGKTPERERPDGIPRIDINLPLGQKPEYSPYRMDYPLPEPSLLVDAAKRGVEEPSIGMQVDYVKAHLHRGLVGYGLGVEVIAENKKALALEDSKARLEAHKPDNDIMYQVLIYNGDALLIDGTAYGAQRMHYALPAELIAALESAEQPRLGMTIKLEKTALKVVLKTGRQGEIQFSRSVPLSETTRQKLLERPIAIMGFDANHRMTPYLNDGRELNPNTVDLNQAAAPNVWRNPGDAHADRLFGAIWKLGEEQTPESVKSLYAHMLAAADQSSAVQLEALERFRKQRRQLAADIAATGSEFAGQAIEELSGTTLRLVWGKPLADGSRSVAAVIDNASEVPVSGEMVMAFKPEADTEQLIERKKVTINAGGQARIKYQVAKPVWGVQNKIAANATLQWEGQGFTLQASDNDRPYEGVTLEIAKPARIEGDEIVVDAVLLGPFGGKNIGKIEFELMPGNLVEQAVLEDKVDMGIYEVKTYQKRFKLKPGVEAKRFAVNIQADFVADGEDLRLTARSVYE